MNAKPWLFVSTALTIVIGFLLLVLPLYSSVEEGLRTHKSLLDVEGWGVAALLGIPVAVSAVPLLTPRRARRVATVGATVVLGIGAFLGSASIGLFYVPTVVSMAVAASRMSPPRQTLR